MAPVIILWVSLLIPCVRSCLPCDPRVKESFNIFLNTTSDPAERAAIEEQIDCATRTFTRHPKAQRIRHIDPATLRTAADEYLAELAQFLGNVYLHADRLTATRDVLDKGGRILKKHLAETGHCPNKCGLLYQRVIQCATCTPRMKTCSISPKDRFCGERHLEAEEGNSAVLYCSLPWHNLIVGDKQYQFSLSSGPSGQFTVFSATSSSSVVLNHVTWTDQGWYQCQLLDGNKKVLTSLKYQLTVKPSPPTTGKPVTSLPDVTSSLPDVTSSLPDVTSSLPDVTGPLHSATGPLHSVTKPLHLLPQALLWVWLAALP